MITKPDIKKSVGYIRHPGTLSELDDWGVQPDAVEGESHNTGTLLYKNEESDVVESGLWICTPGHWRLEIPGDELCHFLDGDCTYTEENGDVIEVKPGTVVHFGIGWKGECVIRKSIRNVYMFAEKKGAEKNRTNASVLRDPETVDKLEDWGTIDTMLEGESHTSGILFQDGKDGNSESGLWVCTPGYWRCHVTQDEFCHFLSGYCTYEHESGEVIDVEPDTIVFFPGGWKGTCRVTETVRKVYMIR